MTSLIAKIRDTIFLYTNLDQRNDEAEKRGNETRAANWQRNPQSCRCGTPMIQALVPNDLHNIGDMICPKCEHDLRVQQINRLNAAPMKSLFAQAGEYVRRVHSAITVAAVEAATPISLIATIKPMPQLTGPLPARDIERSNTTVDIDQIATLKNNPATPTPEVRAALFAEVPEVAETLILWEPDPDATDRRVIVRRADGPRNTRQIPAMQAEILLESMMRKPAHEQSTGENERLPEKHWML